MAVWFSTDALYNKVHTVEARNGNSPTEYKPVNIMIKKDHDFSLLIKLRDTNTFLFSYTAVINRNNFYHLKKNQSLDIDFEEFETHLIEMLASNLNNEMLLKCELENDGMKCRLIFYEKSKIKSLIFLTIEMTITSQKDLIEEMENCMQHLQESNRKLMWQLNIVGDKLKVKENEIVKNNILIRKIEETFLKDTQNLNKIFLDSLGQCESLLAEKICLLSNKIFKINTDVSMVKNENRLKGVSNARLVKSIENLREENLTNIHLVNKLKTECSSYENLYKNLQNEVLHLNQLKTENDKQIKDLQKQLEEYRKDLEESALVIAKSTERYSELERDIGQANHIIKDYNKYYELKTQEVAELKVIIASKEDLIKEQIFQNNQLFKEYQEYKLNFNSEQTENIMSELAEAKSKIETLEKEKREMVKLNGLLTKKISSTNFFS